jgi:hypothetical protein
MWVALQPSSALCVGATINVVAASALTFFTESDDSTLCKSRAAGAADAVMLRRDRQRNEGPRLSRPVMETLDDKSIISYYIIGS